MTHQYRVGERTRIVKLVYKSEGRRVGDIVVIQEVYDNDSPYPYRAEGKLFSSDELAPVFEVGDEVEVLKIIQHPYSKKWEGNRGVITFIGCQGVFGIDEAIWLDGAKEGGEWFIDKQLKLIKKGAGMSFRKGDKVRIKGEVNILGYIIENDNEYNESEYVQTRDGNKLHYDRSILEKIGETKMSLRDRIEKLTGWDKEGEEIFQKVKGGYYLQMNNLSDTSGRFMINPTYKTPYMDFMNNTYEVQFAFQSSCKKLRAFKDALLWLLDKSGIEKSKVREGLEAEVKELKDKLVGLERKIEGVGK
jgi:hypothetical protein